MLSKESTSSRFSALTAFTVGGFDALRPIDSESKRLVVHVDGVGVDRKWWAEKWSDGQTLFQVLAFENRP